MSRGRDEEEGGMDGGIEGISRVVEPGPLSISNDLLSSVESYH
jgi:hypothetical protein